MAAEFTDAPPPASSPPAPRGHPLIAWGVIIAAAVGLFLLRLLIQPPAEVKEFDAFEIQARALVGAANLGPMGAAVYEQAKEFNHGPVGQRLRFVALAGELQGPDEALKQWDALQSQINQGGVKADDQELETSEVLGRLYRDYKTGDPAATDVTEKERHELRSRLGWFGDLALNPRNGLNPAARAAVIAPAQRLVFAEFGILAVALGGGAVGFILLILFFVLWRQMRSRFHAGSPFGGIYAETFSVWMVLFIGLNIGGAFLLRLLPPYLPDELLSGIAALLSLSALAWPVLRGASWRQVRRDIGWTAGDKPALEPFCGVLCYLAFLPVVLLMLLGLVIFLQFGQKFTGHDVFGPDTPTHPIVDKVLHSGWWGWIQAVFLASVVAPLMEETMFRGVLYRHMREATGRLGRWGSVIVSALVVSFLFAALHPQGLLAVPVLMALAFGFTAAREWRGSLIPSMTVHALHNGALMLMLILAAS
jgi:membrane protease YdiL (CAAX protease family)